MEEETTILKRIIKSNLKNDNNIWVKSEDFVK